MGRIYIELQMTLLHTKYTSFGFCGFRAEDFFIYFHYKPMEDNDAPRAWPVWTAGGGGALAGFIKRSTVHWYTRKVKALGRVVSEIFMFVPL